MASVSTCRANVTRPPSVHQLGGAFPSNLAEAVAMRVLVCDRDERSRGQLLALLVAATIAFYLTERDP